MRIFDVAFLGPLMIYAAAAPSEIPTWARIVLGVSGACTIAYNGINLVRRASAAEGL